VCLCWMMGYHFHCWGKGFGAGKESGEGVGYDFH
jgi:hypothetical protein